MTRDNLIMSLKSFFLKNLNRLNDSNIDRLPFSIFYISNQVKLISSDIEFTLVIHFNKNKNITYKLVIDKLKELKEVTKNDHREAVNHELIKTF